MSSVTSGDRMRDVSHNFNADGFESLYPKHSHVRPDQWTTRSDLITRVTSGSFLAAVLGTLM